MNTLQKKNQSYLVSILLIPQFQLNDQRGLSFFSFFCSWGLERGAIPVFHDHRKFCTSANIQFKQLITLIKFVIDLLLSVQNRKDREREKSIIYWKKSNKHAVSLGKYERTYLKMALDVRNRQSLYIHEMQYSLGRCFCETNLIGEIKA